jgi:hypothetical protein
MSLPKRTSDDSELTLDELYDRWEKRVGMRRCHAPTSKRLVSL